MQGIGKRKMLCGKQICAMLCAALLGLGCLSGTAEAAQAIGGFFKQLRQANDMDRDGQGEYELLHQNFAALSLDKESRQRYPALARTLDNMAKQQWQQARKTREDMKNEARSFRENNPKYYHPLAHDVDVLPRRADDKVVSFLSMEYTGGSGAHGMYGWQGVNLSTDTGEEIHLSQVVQDMGRLTDVVTKRLRQDYPQGCYAEMEELVHKMALQDELNWSLDPKGITFYFNPYAIGPYAAGLMEATVLFAEEPDLFTETYRETAESYAQPFPDWYPLTTSMAGGRDVLALRQEGKQLIIEVNGTVHSFRAELDDLHPVLIDKEGQIYLYVDGISSEGSRRTMVFRMEGEKPHHLATLPYTFLHTESVSPAEQRYWNFLTNPDGFYMDRAGRPGASTKTDICAVGENGLLTFG